MLSKKPVTEHSTLFASLTALRIALLENAREALVAANNRQQAQVILDQCLNNVIADLQKIRTLVANLNNNNESSTGAVTITDDHFIQQLLTMTALAVLTAREHSQVNTSNLFSMSTVILEPEQPQQRPSLQLTLTDSIITDESEWNLCLSTAVDLREHSPPNDYPM